MQFSKQSASQMNIRFLPQLKNTKALRLGAGHLQKAIYQSRGCHPHLLPNTEHKGKAIKIFPVIEFWSKCRKCSLARERMYIHPHLHPQSRGMLLAMCSASLLPSTMLSLETTQMIEKTSFCGFCPPWHMQGIKMASAAMWRKELKAVSQHNDSQGKEAWVRHAPNSSQAKEKTSQTQQRQLHHQWARRSQRRRFPSLKLISGLCHESYISS